MSELLNQLKADQLAARKSGDKLRATVLTTLIGEVAPSGNTGDVDDAKIFKTIKTFRDNAAEIVRLRKQRGESAEDAEGEIAILEELLPKQLSDDELEAIVSEQVAAHNIDSMKGMGLIKGYLEQHYKGRYDGSKVAAIVKSKVQ